MHVDHAGLLGPRVGDVALDGSAGDAQAPEGPDGGLVVGRLVAGDESVAHLEGGPALHGDGGVAHGEAVDQAAADEGEGPWQKMGTDVTEFKLSFGRAYLAPAYDFGSKEIVAWSVSEHPDLAQQEEMLAMLVAAKPRGEEPMLHSDMGWQYRHASYVGRLRGERLHPKHVAQGQLHRQRRDRAGLRPYQ